MWPHIVLSVWYILSIETKIKDKMEKGNCKNIWKIKISHQNTIAVIIFFVLWWNNKFDEKFKS